MNNALSLRKVLETAGIIAVALVFGFLLAAPKSYLSLAFLGGVLSLLVSPLIFRWHHELLLVFWNSSIAAFFLPGRPDLWMLLGGISLGITTLNYVMDRRRRMQFALLLSVAVLLLLLVVLATAQLRGGIGFRALGNNVQGGRKYAYIVAAVLAFFAVSSVRLPPARARFALTLFFSGYLALIMSNVAYLLGPSFYWLFNLFPPEFALAQAQAEFLLGQVNRFNGVGVAMAGPFFIAMMHWGARGVLDWRQPWRAGTLLLIVGISMLGGFRSLMVLYGLVFALLFCLEGLWRTRWLPGLLAAALLGVGLLVPVARHLPLAVQRSISFLPVEVAPIVKMDAEGSTEWRLKMWRRLLDELPQYFWLGKGYALSPMDITMAEEAVRRGFFEDHEAAIVAGNYHSGPLSVLIVFGIPGLAAFVFFLWASWRVLLRNYRGGPPGLRDLNRFLLAMFLAKVVFYIGVFGDISADLSFFCGLVGISLAINGTRPERAAAPNPDDSATPASPAH